MASTALYLSDTTPYDLGRETFEKGADMVLAGCRVWQTADGMASTTELDDIECSDPSKPGESYLARVGCEFGVRLLPRSLLTRDTSDCPEYHLPTDNLLVGDVWSIIQTHERERLHEPLTAPSLDTGESDPPKRLLLVRDHEDGTTTCRLAEIILSPNMWGVIELEHGPVNDANHDESTEREQSSSTSAQIQDTAKELERELVAARGLVGELHTSLQDAAQKAAEHVQSTKEEEDVRPLVREAISRYAEQ